MEQKRAPRQRSTVVQTLGIELRLAVCDPSRADRNGADLEKLVVLTCGEPPCQDGMLKTSRLPRLLVERFLFHPVLPPDLAWSRSQCSGH